MIAICHDLHANNAYPNPHSLSTMAEKSEPGAFDLLVSPEWFVQPSDNELESFPEDMEEIIDQLMSQIEIPVLPLPAIESPAAPEPVPSHVGQFVKANDKELQRLMNKNTQKSTNTWVRRLDGWRKARGMEQELLSDKSIAEMDNILARFYAELRKEDGTDYEPDSLRVMLASLDRHFRGTGLPFSILRDDAFKNSCKVLNGKAIELCERGMGKRKNKADPLTEEDEEALWESGALGGENPLSLNHTIWYLLSQQFGTRGNQEHTEIMMEDLKWVRVPQTNHIRYVEWTEGLTKTRHGGLVKPERRVPQRIFPNGTDRCPVRFLETLISKRPSSLRVTGPLYLTPL